MFVTKKTHRHARLQNYLFLLLLAAIIGSLAWLSTRYYFEADWTATARHSLSPASIALLQQMPHELSITSYASEDQNLRRSISGLIQRYRRYKENISFSFINPDRVPDKVRALGITSNGELLLEYQGRRQNLTNLSEQSITNALQQLARGSERWLVFLSGHGERDPQGSANHDLHDWARQLRDKGFQLQTHTLTSHPQLPDNTSVLVVASPQTELLPGEIGLLRDYLATGGSLLWLTDPDARLGLSLLKDSLGITAGAGVVVDPGTQLLGINDPRFALVGDYPPHDITRNFDTITLFPQAVPLLAQPLPDWHSQALLLSNQDSWSESGQMDGNIRFDQAQDLAGPLSLAYVLQRPHPQQAKRQQRVVVVGDGDFLANAYLGNGGNQMLGLNIINWLAHDDRFIDIPLKTAPDKDLQLSPLAQGMIGFGFLLVLPLLLGAGGFVIWWRRRKR